MIDDTALILSTDVAWFIACAVGVRYGIPILFYSMEALDYSDQTFPRRRNREQFERNRWKAILLLAAVGLGVLLGTLVGVDDLIVLFGPGELEIEFRRFVYRLILVLMVTLISLALRQLYKIYKLYER